MELNLVLNMLRNMKSSNEQAQPQRNLLEGCKPRVEWRETRSSYFLNIDLQGLRRDDVQLEMDNTRGLIIRGQRCVQDIGMVRWRWRLVEHASPSSSRRSSGPFRVAEDVNVGAISARFHHGVLHVAMPKLGRTSFTPFHIPIHSSDHDQHPQRNTRSLQGELADENMEDEKLHTTFEDEKLPEVCVSGPQQQLSGNEIMPADEQSELPCSYSKEECMQEMEQNPSPSSRLHTTIVKEGAAADDFGEENAERSIADEEDYCAGREHWRPLLCKGLCHLLACMGLSIACKSKHRHQSEP